MIISRAFSSSKNKANGWLQRTTAESSSCSLSGKPLHLIRDRGYYQLDRRAGSRTANNPRPSLLEDRFSHALRGVSFRYCTVQQVGVAACFLVSFLDEGTFLGAGDYLYRIWKGYLVLNLRVGAIGLRYLQLLSAAARLERLHGHLIRNIVLTWKFKCRRDVWISQVWT
jgi:hypothetical protein